MKSSFIIVAHIFIICHFGVAQNTFFKWYDTNKYEYIYNAIETQDGKYVLCGGVALNANSIYNAYLLKINSNGDKLLETDNYVGDSATVNSQIFQLTSKPNSLFTTTNNLINKNGNKIFSQSFVEYSISEFTKLNQRTYYSEPNVKIGPQSILQTENYIYILSVYYVLSPFSRPAGFVITKYNNLFDSITSYKELIEYVNPFGIWRDSQTGEIKSFSYLHGTDTYVHNFTPNLELNGISQLSPFITSVSASNLFNDKYLLTGTTDIHYGLDPIYDISVRKYDKNDQITDSVYYYNDPDTLLYSGAVCNTALVGDKIFVTGVYNIDPAHWPYQQEPSWIQVTRLDTALNILDHHFYGGDAYYHPYKIIATTDGGALIVGNRYDYTISEKLYHAFALKVNSDGLITELPDHPEAKAHDAIVYPNPGRDNLTIQSGPQINEALFTLYDMQGRAVLSEKITTTQLRLNTSNLPSGTYAWQIVFKNKVIESGKWVKE